MFTVVITEKGGAERRKQFDKPEVTIGRVQGNDIILPKGNVSKRHARVVLKDNRFIVVDLKSTNGTYVNGRKITSPLVVKAGDKIYIGDFIMTVEDAPSQAPVAESPAPEPMPPQRERKPTEQSVSPSPFGGAPPSAPASSPSGPPPLPPRSPSQPGFEGAPSAPGLPSAPGVVPSAPGLPSAPGQASSGGAFGLDQDPGDFPALEPPSLPEPPAQPAFQPPVKPASAPPPAYSAPPPQPAPQAAAQVPQSTPQPAPQAAPAASPAPAALPAYEPIRSASSASLVDIAIPGPVAGMAAGLRQVMALVAARFDVSDVQPHAMRDQARWQEAESVAEAAIRELGATVSSLDRDALRIAAVREAVGLGPLEELLTNEGVREMVVEGPNRVVADYGKGLRPVEGSFSSNDAVVIVARRLVAQTGERLDPSKPIHEATLPYGPHVTVVLPPVAARGPIIEIRRVGEANTLDQLVSSGLLNADMAALLGVAVEKRRNVLVTGPLGVGVTTLVGALASLVDEKQRIVSVEEVADLAIGRSGVVALSTGAAPGGLTLAQLMNQATRMRADRLVVDDVKAEGLFSILGAVGSAPSGSIVGMHHSADSSAEDNLALLLHIETKAADDAVARLIAAGVKVVVELEFGGNGKSRVRRIAEVTGYDGANVSADELFGFDGDFTNTGKSASFA